MIVRVRKTTDPFARIPKDVLSDKRLSWRAKGILSYLLSKPNNWIVRSSDILAHSTEGRDAVRTVFKELRATGYAVMVQTSNGREWIIGDSARKPCPENPSMEPCPEKAIMAKSPPTKNDKENKNDKNSPAFAEFVKKWMAAYKTHFGDDYAFQGGKDGKAIKALLACSKLGADELVQIASAAWKHGGFFCKGATSIAGFYSKFNEIRQELKTKNNGTGNQGHYTRGSRTVGTSNEGRASQYAGVGRIGQDPRTRV